MEGTQKIQYQVGEAWKGAYNSATNYSYANVVQDHTGLSVYRSLKSGNVGHPLTDTTWWFKIIDMSSIKSESDRIAALNTAIAEAEVLRVAAEEAREQQAAADHATASADHTTAGADHTTAQSDHTTAGTDHQTASADHQQATADHSQYTTDHGKELEREQAETLREQADAQRAIAENNREAAETERHTQYTTDHSNATRDHGTAVSDHATAASDHTQASNDHAASVDATAKASNVNVTIDGMIVTITDKNGVSTRVNIGFDITKTYASVSAMNADAANVEEGTFVMIATTDTTSTENARLYVRNSNAASSETPFTFLCDLDQAASSAWADWFNNYKPTIESDHTRAESDHSTASTDHGTAASDHTQAGTDHTTAQGDHTTAGSDHTLAASDHTTASTDHTTAGNDHTRAETDHSRAESDHAAVEVYVDSLGAFDISAYHATGGVLAKYADLTAALGTNGANIPDALRKGGMSVKFTQSSDNKYVQYFLTATSWSTDVSDWIEGGGGSGHSAYDISAKNNGATYDNLTAALGANGANVPSAVRNGGMPIKYIENVYADYSVVVTEGLTTEPTGTLLESAPSITSGIYKAAQLSELSTLPANPYNSILYYVAVIADGVTTYTQWVVMKMTNDSTKYAHWTYTSSSVENVDFINLNNWIGSAEAKAKLIDEKISDSEWENIPFDGGNYYMNTSNQIIEHSGWRSTKFIPVKEGDRLMYSGSPGAVSKAFVGFAYNGTEYVVKKIWLDRNAGLYKNYPEVVTEGITHVRAFCTQASLEGGTAKLVKYKTSVLDDLIDNIGEVSKTRIYYNNNFTYGSYIAKNGILSSSSNYCMLLTDVKAGDVITLYGWGTTTAISAIAKQLTPTTFKPLLVSGEKGNKTYTAEEDMTIAISTTYLNHVEILSNKFANIDVSIATLNAKQVSNEQYQEWLNEYNYKLGYMFNKIAVIGDSMSVGSISTESSAAPNSNMGASWLSDLAKRWNCISRMHYARGGASCYTWLNSSEYGLGIMLADTRIYNAYFIAMGHNDGGSDYSGVGEVTDAAAPVTVTEGVPSCPSGYSFCAYYKAIIDKIRAKAPHAMIFCLSEYDDVMTGGHSAYSQAVKDIAELYYNNGDTLVHHLDTGGVPVSGMDLGSHYSTIGYFHIAKRVDEEANKVIWNHRTDIAIKEFGIYNNVNARYAEYVTQ